MYTIKEIYLIHLLPCLSVLDAIVPLGRFYRVCVRHVNSFAESSFITFSRRGGDQRKEHCGKNSQELMGNQSNGQMQLWEFTEIGNNYALIALCRKESEAKLY